MAITIQGPDGASIDFPEGTSEADMSAAMAQAYPHPSGMAPPSGGPGVMAGVSRALEANLPFVDRAVAAAKSTLPQGYGGTGQDYAENLASEKAKNAQFAEQNPWTNAVGGITAYAPAALIPGGSGLYGRIGAGALTGFGLGGIQGASNSPDLTNTQETGKSIAQGELEGGALGAGFPAIAHGIGQGYSALADALRGGPGPADLAALGTAKNAAYQNVKDLGAAYSPASFKSLTDKIASDAAKADIDPDLNPKASKIIENLQNRSAEAVKSGTPVTLTDLDKARQFVNDNLSGLPEPKQARFGSLIKDNIDDFVNTAFPGDMVPMPVKAAAPSGQGTLPLEGTGPTPADVSGAAVSGAAESRDASSRPQIPTGPAPTPMLDFLRSAGGLKDEGGDLASMGFANLNGRAAKGSSKIIDKENGLPMDEARRMAVEQGYMEPHEEVSDLINKLGEHPTYSVHDEEAVATRSARDAYDQGPQEEERAQAPRLVVARRFPNGEVKYGKPGDIHSDLLGNVERPSDKEMGFAEPGGPFMSRQEAANFTAQNEPSRRPEFYEPEESFLQAEPYTEPERLARFDYEQGNAPISPSSPAAPVASAKEAAAAISNARDLAQRQFKANALLDALNKAKINAAKQGIGGNTENAARQRLAAILDQEPWSPDEKAQLNKMVLGTPVTNTLREASRLSPFQNTLMKVAEGTTFAGAPTTTTLAAALGSGAHLAGNIARRSNQNELMRTILAGGKAPVKASPQQAPVSRAAMTAALAANAQRNQATQP